MTVLQVEKRIELKETMKKFLSQKLNKSEVEYFMSLVERLQWMMIDPSF